MMPRRSPGLCVALSFTILVLGIVHAAPGAAVPLHDFHVSITTIDHNPRTQALEITVKIFTDDLERSIQALGGGNLYLGGPNEAADADSLVHAYLRNRLSLALDGRPATYAWVGKEVELDAVWCYVEVTQVGKFSSLEITNRILTELFDDQANVVHCKVRGASKSLFLSKNAVTDRVSF